MATYPAGTHTVGPGQFPYPDGTMPPFPPGDMQQLATRVNTISGSGIGNCATTAARDALVTNGDAFPGLVVYCADTGLYQRYTGSGWVTFAQSVEFSGLTDDFTGGQVQGPGVVENSSTQSVTVPAGATAILTVRMSVYFFLSAAASFSGGLHLVVNGTRDYGSTTPWRYTNHGRAGALTFTASWEVNLTPGTYTVGVAVVEDTGDTAHETWDLQTSVVAKW